MIKDTSISITQLAIDWLLSVIIEFDYVYTTITLILDLKLILVLVCNWTIYATITLKLLLELS